MWSKWEERFKSFGAKRIQFTTSRRGGPKDSKAITGAKCLMFFDCKEDNEREFLLENIIQKTLCSETLEVTVLDEDFGYQVKDSTSGSYYGTKANYPALKFFPPDLAESKGKQKHKPALVMSRVFKLKKHQQRAESGGRITTYSFSEMSGEVIAAHLKGACWGEFFPPDEEKRKLQEYYSKPRYFKREEHECRCIYDFYSPSQVMKLINNFEAGTFSKWKRFRGIGFEKKYVRTSKC